MIDEPGGEPDTFAGSEAPAEEGATPAAVTPTGSLRQTRTWGFLALRAYLAVVFFQAAIGHLEADPSVLAGLWAPHGVFAPLGKAALADPALFVDTVSALELALALSVTIGLLTRIAGFGGVVLNAFFFAAFEWGDVGQLYLSWDAALAALWMLVLLFAPGRVLGVAQWLRARYPRWASWYT